MGWEVHVREVGTVALGLVLSQGWVLPFPFLDKGNELSVSLKGFRLVVLQWEHLAELLSHCRFVLMGHAAKYLSLDVCHAELVCGTGEGRTDGILYALKCIGNDQVYLLDASLPQCLKLVFPAQGTLSGMIDNREHLPAAVLQYSQNSIVGLLGHLPVPAGGDKGGINVDG